jgi:hypothetical protein
MLNQRQKPQVMLMASANWNSLMGWIPPLRGGLGATTRRQRTTHKGTYQLQTGFHLILIADALAILLHGMNGNLQLLGNLKVGSALQQ